MEEEIVKKAIEGGYKYVSDNEKLVFNKHISCDSLFWQALGKACGWNESDCIYTDGVEDGVGYVVCDGGGRIPVWQSQALSFHEINLTKGWDTAVEYLTNLINPQ
jgi:hypothetical protein